MILCIYICQVHQVRKRGQFNWRCSTFKPLVFFSCSMVLKRIVSILSLSLLSLWLLQFRKLDSLDSFKYSVLGAEMQHMMSICSWWCLLAFPSFHARTHGDNTMQRNNAGSQHDLFVSISGPAKSCPPEACKWFLNSEIMHTARSQYLNELNQWKRF